MDELWYSESHTKDVKLSLKVKNVIHQEKSKYQTISVFESAEFGRFLTLDGRMMLTEKDEFVYHEMISHIPLNVNNDIKNVLVVGAGDGGVLRELIKYSTIETIDLVEIDDRVIEVSKEHLKFTSVGFLDKRVNIIIADGIKYVRKFNDYYDLIIIDSTDPFGPGEVLFTKEFYGSCYKALKENGLLVNQHETAFYSNFFNEVKQAHQNIKSIFEVSLLYQANIPTYPSGMWLFGFASKGLHPLHDQHVHPDLKKMKLKYYNENLHKGAFMLPTYILEELNE